MTLTPNGLGLYLLFKNLAAYFCVLVDRCSAQCLEIVRQSYCIARTSGRTFRTNSHLCGHHLHLIPLGYPFAPIRFDPPPRAEAIP